MAQIDVWYEAELNRAKLEEKQTIALKMLRKNLPLETGAKRAFGIARITELTIEQIQKLRSNNYSHSN
jgi:hypothetical protein